MSCLGHNEEMAALTPRSILLATWFCCPYQILLDSTAQVVLQAGWRWQLPAPELPGPRWALQLSHPSIETPSQLSTRVFSQEAWSKEHWVAPYHHACNCVPPVREGNKSSRGPFRRQLDEPGGPGQQVNTHPPGKVF